MYAYDGSFGFDYSVSGGLSGSIKAERSFLSKGLVSPFLVRTGQWEEVAAMNIC
eukprot:gene19031-19377_t